MIQKLFLLSLLILGITLQAQAARLYKWVDESGNVSYHDRAPPDGKYKVETQEYGERDETDQRNAASLRSVALQYPVTLYMTEKCASCDLLRQYLKGKKIPFKEKNAGKDLKIQAELTEIAGELVVPILTIGKEVVRGYSQTTLDKKLMEVGYLKAPEKSEPDEDQLDTETKESQ